MPAPRKYSPELIERGVQMVIKMRRQDPGRSSVVREVGEQLGVHPEVLRHWVNKANCTAGQQKHDDSSSERLRQLEEENADLRRINAILRSAAALFAAELEPGGRLMR
nr:hypothetical protein KitaXyl93_34620 [Kitasatospora sp. Xyl93]